MPIETNLNIAPYFDDFDETKNFHRVMFRPSVAVQARELTQLQTILQNQIERFGDNIFKVVYDHINSNEYTGLSKINDTFSYFVINKELIDAGAEYLKMLDSQQEKREKIAKEDKEQKKKEKEDAKNDYTKYVNQYSKDLRFAGKHIEAKNILNVLENLSNNKIANIIKEHHNIMAFLS